MLFASIDPDINVAAIASGLGIYYLILAAMNGIASLYLWRKKHRGQAAFVWALVAGGFVLLAALSLNGDPNWTPQRPYGLKELSMLLSGKTGAIVYSLGTTLALVFLYVFRRFFVQPLVAWTMLNVALLLMGLCAADKNFQAIVTKPDNVPIVALVFFLGYFTRASRRWKSSTTRRCSCGRTWSTPS
jgi:hypothetical protein